MSHGVKGHLEGEQAHLRDLLTMVTDQLLIGMILQVRCMFMINPPGNDKKCPTKRENLNNIDSKVPLKGDMLVGG